MSQPNIDEVINLLSSKFNRIFCEREFISCVSEDFKSILNENNKNCVLVFPALGSLYLKAIRFQAEAFNLAVFGISAGSYQSVAVCHKECLLINSIQLEKQEIMSETPCTEIHTSLIKKKRPERQLYIPPAQRKSRLHQITDKHERCQKLNQNSTNFSDNQIRVQNNEKHKTCIKFNVPKDKTVQNFIDSKTVLDLIDLISFVEPTFSFGWKYEIAPNIFQLNKFHEICCEFYQFILVRQKDIFLNIKIPIFSHRTKPTLYILKNDYVYWQPDTQIYSEKNLTTDYIFPNFSFQEPIEEICDVTNYFLNLSLEQVLLFDNLGSIHKNDQLSVIQSSLLDDMINESRVIFENHFPCNNVSKIICDCDIYQNIMDLSEFKLGHVFCIELHGEQIYHICEEEHDAKKCYIRVKESLEAEPRIISRNVNENSSQDHVIMLDQKTDLGHTTDRNNLKNKNTDLNNDEKCREETTDPIKREAKRKDKTISKKNELEQEKEIMRKAKENINRKTRPIMKYVEHQDDLLKIEKEDNINNWEDLFDEEGQLQEDLLSEIVQKVGRDVTIVKAVEDYTPYANINKPDEDLEHIVELYNFPSSLRTADLMHAFNEFDSDSMYIKWVNETHALLVLGSYTQAQRAVDMDNPLIKVRPISSASPAAVELARSSDLKPAMKRPQTNLQTARRLITSHLGAKSKLTREENAREREVLKNAREMRKITKQNETDAWEGNIRSSVK